MTTGTRKQRLEKILRKANFRVSRVAAISLGRRMTAAENAKQDMLAARRDKIKRALATA